MKIHLPPKLLFGLIIIQMVSYYFFPLSVLHPFFGFSGLFFIGFGVVVMNLARKIIMRASTTLDPEEKPCALVIEGPFRFSRNPIYLGHLSILLGIASILPTIFSFISAVIYIIVINSKVIPKEEGNLIHIFGDKYIFYQNHVRRWI